ncbi:MAG: LytTR family DNA-binding domain-containing protein [Bacteroidota bacterium]
MVHCFIIDDDQYAITSITSNLRQVAGIAISGCFLDPRDAVKALQSGLSVDLIFLDVQVPLLSGIDLAAMVPSHVAIIFTTSFTRHAHEAFDLNAVDFLMKPYSYERFARAVQKAMAFIKETQPTPAILKNASEPSIFLACGNGSQLRQVRYADITHVQSLKNYVAIHFLTDKIISYISMKEISQQLPNDLFVRIHCSYLVNLAHIELADAHGIMLSIGIRLPIGDSHMRGFKEMIKDRLLKSSRQ